MAFGYPSSSGTEDNNCGDDYEESEIKQATSTHKVVTGEEATDATTFENKNDQEQSGLRKSLSRFSFLLPSQE